MTRITFPHVRVPIMSLNVVRPAFDLLTPLLYSTRFHLIYTCLTRMSFSFDQSNLRLIRFKDQLSTREQGQFQAYTQLV